MFRFQYVILSLLQKLILSISLGLSLGISSAYAAPSGSCRDAETELDRILNESFKEKPIPPSHQSNQHKIWQAREAGSPNEARRLEQQTEQSLRTAELARAPVAVAGSGSGAMKVLFKDGTVGIWKPAVGGVADGNAEIAAYRIDRQLGLNMVPVTVEREINGVKGTVQYYIKGSAKGVTRDPQQFYLFDSLIGNTDRAARNYLSVEDRAILIDHGQAFKIDDRAPFANILNWRMDQLEKPRARTQQAIAELESARHGNAPEHRLQALQRGVDEARAIEEAATEPVRAAVRRVIMNRTVYDSLRNTTKEQWWEILKHRLTEKQYINFMARKDKILKAMNRAVEELGPDIISDEPFVKISVDPEKDNIEKVESLMTKEQLK